MCELEDHWYDDEPITRTFCDNYIVHLGHCYQAINGNVYQCVGLSNQDMADMIALSNRPPCEHGLSADLCYGFGHYPPDM